MGFLAAYNIYVCDLISLQEEKTNTKKIYLDWIK